ncbi:MAG: hypothetical protein GY849_19545 [Deltaproteobacteria bacterium]|nr:hypothetical protein [Deltaproteobacteria bacterium]
MTNLQKALELIKKYTSKQKSGNGDWVNSVILPQYAKKAVEIASKTDWFYPSKNEFPKNGEEVWVSKFNPIRRNKEMGFDVDDKDFWIKYIEAWCYLPTL